MAKEFLGFRQVSAVTYSSYTDEQKKGYLWLVRDKVTESGYTADIYFGTRHYAHVTPDILNFETIISEIRNDISGLSEDIEEINNSIDELRELIEENQAVLTQDLEVVGVTVGNLTSGKSFASGTTIENVLRSMLMKEISVDATKPSASITLKDAINNTVNDGSTYEVGTVLTIKMVPGYTDGKFTGKSGYSYTLTAGCASSTTEYYYNSTKQDSDTYSFTDGITSGTHTFSVDYTYGASTNKPVTNMGNDAGVSIAAGTTSKASKSIKADYRYYYGNIDNSTFNTMFEDSGYTSIISSLTKNWLSNKTIGSFTNTHGTTFVIAVPFGTTVTSIKQMGLSVELDSEVHEMTIGGTSNTPYTIYYIQNVSDSSDNDFTDIIIS